jgi:hypothetical protein
MVDVGDSISAGSVDISPAFGVKEKAEIDAGAG